MERKISKFDISDLLPIGLTFVVLGIVLAYGLNVQGDVRDDFCGDGDNQFEHLSGGICYTCPNSTHNNFIAAGVCANATQSAGMDNATASVGGSADFNASVNSITGVAKIPEKLPLIATVVVAAVIIGILIRYLMVRFG